mmetsp:Transcript_60398/g.124167  ORF Transcript_60398/g.124167 Transcript_60398/m.124167 type:complete len:306 (-) Transcript_60398:339-1256(-)
MSLQMDKRDSSPGLAPASATAPNRTSILPKMGPSLSTTFDATATTLVAPDALLAASPPDALSIRALADLAPFLRGVKATFCLLDTQFLHAILVPSTKPPTAWLAPSPTMNGVNTALSPIPSSCLIPSSPLKQSRQIASSPHSQDNKPTLSSDKSVSQYMQCAVFNVMLSMSNTNAPVLSNSGLSEFKASAKSLAATSNNDKRVRVVAHLASVEFLDHSLPEPCARGPENYPNHSSLRILAPCSIVRAGLTPPAVSISNLMQIVPVRIVDRDAKLRMLLTWSPTPEVFSLAVTFTSLSRPFRNDVF